MAWYEADKPVGVVGNGKQSLRLMCDTAADVVDLPNLEKAAPGSTCLCLSPADLYVLKSTNVWEAI